MLANGKRRPVRCVACRVTFLRPEHYLVPTHACVRESQRKHPSSQDAQ